MLSKEEKIWKKSKQKSLQEHASVSARNLLSCESKKTTRHCEMEGKGEVKRRQQALELHACFFKLPIQLKVFSSAC